jgi:hypothetical protein
MRIAADGSSKGKSRKPRKNRGHVGRQRAVFCHANADDERRMPGGFTGAAALNGASARGLLSVRRSFVACSSHE